MYADEMDLYNASHTYITAPMNGDWEEHVMNHPERKAELVLWNLERPGSGEIRAYRDANVAKVQSNIIDKIIVSDRFLARQTGHQYVPLGCHFGLGDPGTTKEYDVAHLACYAPRRAWLFDYLTPLQHYNGVSIAPNGWGEERHKTLQETRFMLCVHQDEHPIIEPLRYAIAVAYGLPIISEYSEDIFPYTPEEVQIVSPIQRFPIELFRMRSNYYLYKDVALRVRQRMCTDMSFRKCLEKYL